MNGRRLVLLFAAALACQPVMALAQTADHLSIRGHQQTLHLYGKRGGQAVVVSSGDGGWIHLGPQAAEMLAARGYFVVGFDTRAYLESFTSSGGTLRPADEPADFKTHSTKDEFVPVEELRRVMAAAGEPKQLWIVTASDHRFSDNQAGLQQRLFDALAWIAERR